MSPLREARVYQVFYDLMIHIILKADGIRWQWIHDNMHRCTWLDSI